MKLIELIIDETMELSGIDAVSIVENPAIEENWIALKNEQKEYHFAEVSKEKKETALSGFRLKPKDIDLRY